MKSISLLLLAATATASPLLEKKQSTCLSSAGISAARAAEVRSKFQSSGVIADVVPDIQPTTELTVKYGNINENLGNTFIVLRMSISLTLAPLAPPYLHIPNVHQSLHAEPSTDVSGPETLQEPTFSFPPEQGLNPATTKYTYIQVDPDTPGPALPILRQFLHHIVYDVQPSCIAAQNPKTQARYMALTPLSVSAHRYVSLIYRQPDNYSPAAKPGRGSRKGAVRFAEICQRGRTEACWREFHEREDGHDGVCACAGMFD